MSRSQPIGRRTRRAIPLVAALSMLVVSVPATAAPAPAIRGAGAPNAIPDSYLVVLDNAAVRAADVASRHGASVTHTYGFALTGFAATMTEQQAERTAADPDVAYVEQDQRVQVDTDQTNPVWNLDRIDQRNETLDAKYNYLTTASNVHAYVIDTGMRLTHDQFGGRASSGFDAIDGGSADDCNGHGTHVAGTLGGKNYGVAKAVSLVAVRVLNCVGAGTIATVVAGVDWVTGHAVHPAVANVSLGGGASDVLDAAVVNSIDSGVTYAISAGNSDASACGYSPARVRPAIVVGATDRNDLRADFSNKGACLDVFAPGVDIKSAWYQRDDNAATASGTSMAAPHAAGVAALHLATHPTATPAQVQAAVIDYATKNVVRDPGSGSPNRLLYRPKDPNVAGLSCRSDPIATISCSMSHAHTTGTVAIRWYTDGTHVPAWNDRTSITGNCSSAVPRVRVTITAANGSDFSEDVFACEYNG